MKKHFVFAILFCINSFYSFSQEILSLHEVESQITGAGSFQLVAPRLDVTCNLFNVEDFGLKTSNTPDENAAALAAISLALRSAKRSVLVFPANSEYVVKVKKGQRLFYFYDADDLLIEGNGARIKFQDADESVSSSGFFHFEKCERVILRNLSVGCDWDYKPLALIGKLTEFDAANNEGVYDIISHGELSEKTDIWAALAWDTIAKTRTVNGLESNIKSYEIVNPKKLKVVFQTKFNNSIIGQHSLISIHQNMQYSGVVLEGNDHVLINNVYFLGIPLMAVEGRDRTETQHLVIRNCVLAPPEEDTYFSAGEGFDVTSSWYLFENNVIKYCYDDVMNFDAGLIGSFLGGGLVTSMEEELAENEIIADKLQHFFAKNVIANGAKMGIADENFKPTGWESTITSFQFQLNYYPGAAAAHRCIIRFKDKLPDNIQSNYILYSPRSEEGGYIIRNNTIENCFRHAIWAGNGNGLIENNTIYQSGYPAIMLQMTTRWERWFKGYYPDNVIIRGNKLLNCNTTLRQPASLFIGGGYDTTSAGFFPVDYEVTSNVLIENNEITNSYQAAIGAWSSKNIIIRNNTIDAPSLFPLAATSNGNGALFVKKSKNIFVLNNTISNTTDSYEKDFVNEDNTNIEISGNTGF